MRTKCLFKVFLAASMLLILIGLECLWTMPTSSVESERSVFSCTQWIVDHIIRLFLCLTGGLACCILKSKVICHIHCKKNLPPFKTCLIVYILLLAEDLFESLSRSSFLLTGIVHQRLCQYPHDWNTNILCWNCLFINLF